MTELERIAAVGARDATLDAHDKAITALEARIPAAAAAVSETSASLEAARAALAEARTAEREVAREVGRYTTRQAQAQRALDSGMGDADAAMRQIDQCKAIIDDLETDQLEKMEAVEEAGASVAAAEAALVRAQAHLQAEREAVPPALEAEHAARATEAEVRAGLWAPLPKDLQARYALVRRKRRYAVAPFIDGTCKACRLRVPLQDASEVRRGFLKSCPGCGRYLIPQD